MPSKSEQIAARVAALLTANLATTGALAVYRDRDDAISREESPVTLVELVDEDTDTLGGPAIMETQADTLRLGVIQCVRSAAWQSVADEVRVRSHALIVADATLRAIAAQIRRDRCEWKPKSADLPFGYCAQIYLFKFHTRGLALDSSL